MPRSINITLNGQAIQAVAGVSIAELLVDHPHPGKHPPLGAIVNNQVTGLGRRLRGEYTVSTVDLTSKAGADIYRRTAVLMLTHAAQRLYPDNPLVVGQSIANGYFCTMEGREISAKVVKNLQTEMERLRDENIPIVFVPMPVEEAVRYYESLQLMNKAEIVRQSRNADVLMAKIGDRLTMPLGPLAPHTGSIKSFSVIQYEDGLVLRFPDREGRPMRRLTPQPRLFASFREAARWNELIGVANSVQLNRHLMMGQARDLIQVAEGLHEKKIVEIADLIATRRKQLRLVLISGPSSSGKTTTTKRLEIQLRVNGIEPLTLNMDNYYLDPEHTPRHPDGTYDFEHIEALDLELLTEHLQRIIGGERVDTPVFDFRNHRRHPEKVRTIDLQPNQVLLMEGIHALNPLISERVPRPAKFKLFVSALTQLSVDEHNRIFTSDTRLLRRIVRDRLFRNYGADDTIRMWDSVRRGERRWIFPFQEDADMLFNSALIYEQAVLTTYARRFLPEVPRESPSYMEVDRLRQFVDFFIPILPDEVPPTSVLREFIGGSAFKY